ncbi:nuclear transport factor 2 family protein [Streptomyces sp. PSKA54]|uniref:Nuclear transport factor 2 family protein n=1 Tax=Streptomyces himalayensis subsp. aureolus TaxID=2758039 RepID=A0A7W2CYR7_9ACTN|nr:nuclear transport factor 2 family protein [Streptomyces himalayensis]MBA4861578.1 nuclear transport factor 2 family protein [Streptomyces himalayensis subsp. aureolus]
MPERNPAVDAAIERELSLLDSEVRRSPTRLGALLHAEFTEFGASGRYWDRASIMEALTGKSEPRVRPFTISRMKGVQLAPDVVHLTFDTDYNGRRAHRSSLWRYTEGSWRLYFHQATPFDAGGQQTG